MLVFRMRSCNQNLIDSNVTMKFIALVLLTFLTLTTSWGSERLFAFLSEYELGSRVSSGEDGYKELPDLEIFGHQFSRAYQFDQNNAIKRVALYVRETL